MKKKDKKKLLKEHKHLVKVLRKGDKRERRREATKQAKEMKHFK